MTSRLSLPRALGLGLLLLAAGGGYWYLSHRSPEAVASGPARPRPVVTSRAEPAPPQNGTFIGTVEATTTVGVAFEVLGRLTSRPASEGDIVSAGDILATIDAQSLRDNRDAARAALAGAEAQLDVAQKALERTRELVQRGSESAATQEAAERNAAVALAQAEQARAQLARAEDGLSRAELKAPMDGIVILTRHDPGTTVAAGDPVLVLASPTGRKVRLTLPTQLLSGIAPGAPFTIRSPELPPEGIKGSLLRIDPVSLSETRMREAEIALGDEAEALAIGQLVNVTPDISEQAVIAVPPEAVFEAEGKTWVWRVTEAEDRRRVTRQEVTPGAPTGDGRIAVSGLSHGDEIVLRGVRSLSEGEEVGPAVPLPGARNPMPVVIGEGGE